MASQPLSTPVAREIETLLVQGFSIEDVQWAIDHQNQQILNKRPVHSLSVLVGAETPDKASSPMSGAIASLMARMTPRKTRSGGLHITGNPVHRSSVAIGSDEELSYASETPHPDVASVLYPDRRKEYEAMVRELSGHAYQLRKRDRARDDEGVTPLTPNELKLSAFNNHCRDIMLYLIDCHCFFKGRVFPSLDTIAEKIGMSKSTTIRTLKKLRDLDFIEWIRRFVTIKKGSEGARNQQTSNLYRIRIPNWIADLVQLFRTPIPDDARFAADQRTLDYAISIASLSARQREREVPDSRYRAKLIAIALESEKRLQLEAQRRDCQVGAAPRLNLFNINEDSNGLAWSANAPALTGLPKPQPS